jgi:3-hydroxy-3-methylglutaryl CoA synthase
LRILTEVRDTSHKQITILNMLVFYQFLSCYAVFTLYSRNVKLEDTYFNRDIEKAFMEYSKSIFEEKTKPSLLISNQVGNMYTPCLYGGLVSLLIR